MSKTPGIYIAVILFVSHLCPNFETNWLIPQAFATGEGSIDSKSMVNDGSVTTAQIVTNIEQELTHKRLSKTALVQIIDIVHKNPKDPHAHIILGNCCDFLGLPEQAMEQYRLAFKFGPKNVQSFLELIKALVRSGQLTAASNLLKQAMEKFPTDSQILFWTGNALYREHRFDEAATLYEEALANSEKPIPGLRSSLASLYLQQGLTDKALELAMTDLSYNKRLPEANEIVGLILLQQCKYEQAKTYLNIAYFHNPNNYQIAFGFAKTLFWCGKYKDAYIPALFAIADAANSKDRSFAENIITQIVSHLSPKFIKETTPTLGRFRELEQNPYVHLELAKICLDKNLLNLALAECFVTAQINPNSAEAKFRLALILENYKHYYPAALQSLREAQVLEPANREINQHLMRLEDRMTVNKSDWAWQIKDWLTGSNLVLPHQI